MNTARPLPPRVPQAKQWGASLIELMVGLTIGMLVVLAATSTVVLTRSSSTTVSDSSLMMAQGSNAMRLMAQQLRQSGAIELTPIDPAQPPASRQYLFSNIYTGVGGAGLTLSGTEGGAAPDDLTVSFENRGNNVTRDCLGNTTAAGAGAIQSAFSVVGTDLQCLGSGNVVPQPIAENVEDFQVLYWVQQGVAPAQTQIRRNASQVVAAGGWNSVVAVDVCLQMRGELTDHPIIAGSTFVNCREVATAQDGRLHQVFRSTIYLRNQGQ
jgi:type IV pilus assembly protein PilW